ncbi:MAG TPA: tetratricopeptide repeat protein [Gemmatimonadales bacterium]|jgi:Flp pilus assembly protein TadD|nr:tetratricopeptide repeat protein [Gemmatimonadales bacterium]
MPRARRRRHSGRFRAPDEVFGPPGDPLEPVAARWRRLAREAAAAGRSREAIDHYERILATDPLQADARIALAQVLERDDRPDLAVLALDDGLARQPDHIELLLARGRAHGQERQYDAAEADLRRVMRLQPAQAAAHFELGLILVRRGRAAEAAEAFARAVALGPANAAAHVELAEALNQSGRLTDAAAALERAVALDPTQSRAYNLLGRVLDRLERSDEATLMYRRARALAGQ